jgi:inorganic phosphate transporter, PiT family
MMTAATIYIVVIIATALFFDMCNGMNDAANSIATVVATRVLSPQLAVIWAAFFNFIAAFGFGTHVAGTIGRGLIAPGVIDPHLIFATLIAAIIWTYVCRIKGLPISVSHSLIGALAGTAIVKGGFGALIWSTIGKIAIFIVLSPLIGLALGSVLTVAVLWVSVLMQKLFPRLTVRGMDRIYRIAQLFSAAVYSLSHGLNDARKTMGIIFALLLSQPALQHYATRSGDPASRELAWWIILSCHAAIALGTYLGGWKVVKTPGPRVTKLQPMTGFAAETSGGITILTLSTYGIPVSTTHAITGAIFGVGLVHSTSGVRWSVGADIVTAWVLTMPASGLMGALIYGLLRLFVS